MVKALLPILIASASASTAVQTAVASNTAVTVTGPFFPDIPQELKDSIRAHGIEMLGLDKLQVERCDKANKDANDVYERGMEMLQSMDPILFIRGLNVLADWWEIESPKARATCSEIEVSEYYKQIMNRFRFALINDPSHIIDMLVQNVQAHYLYLLSEGAQTLKHAKAEDFDAAGLHGATFIHRLFVGPGSDYDLDPNEMAAMFASFADKKSEFTKGVRTGIIDRLGLPEEEVAECERLNAAANRLRDEGIAKVQTGEIIPVIRGLNILLDYFMIESPKATQACINISTSDYNRTVFMRLHHSIVNDRKHLFDMVSTNVAANYLDILAEGTQALLNYQKDGEKNLSSFNAGLHVVNAGYSVVFGPGTTYDLDPNELSAQAEELRF